MSRGSQPYRGVKEAILSIQQFPNISSKVEDLDTHCEGSNKGREPDESL